MTPGAMSGQYSNVNIKLGLNINKAKSGRGATQTLVTRDGKSTENRDAIAKSMLSQQYGVGGM